MTVRGEPTLLAVTLVCAALAACRSAPVPVANHASPERTAAARARVALSRTLPPLDGAHVEVTVVEVTYGPGGSSPPHSHPCAVVGYVVEGALRTQVKGEPEAVYRAGESFYEGPNGVHLVSANASQERPARFIAYFACDRRTPLSVAVPDSGAAGRQ